MLSGCASARFDLQDAAGSHMDVLMDGKVAARYMYAHDTSSDERLLETYKPYLHVFNAEGTKPITKGAGGQFTHHRGIFIGWMKVTVDGKNYDRWHMKGGEIVHQKFLKQEGGKKSAMLVSETHWNDEAGAPLIREERIMEVRPGDDSSRLLIDCTFKLTALRGDTYLDGDPEHAGVQYRPADEVVCAETVYVFPKVDADPKKDRDYPWVGESYTLQGKRYSVVHMNHSDNPKDTIYSAYRDYGRFGAFFRETIKKDETLTVKYRFMITDGEMPTPASIQSVWDEFSGVSVPSAIPATTEVSAAPKKRKPKRNAKK